MKTVGLVVLVAGIAAAASAAPGLRAGAAAVDITPREFPVNLRGGFEPKPATGAHDPLHARALVLDDGTVTAAIVVVDSLNVAREAADEARAMARDRCGIAPENILVASTHTHSAPSSNSRTGPAPERAYREVLVNGIAESILRAHAALRPASAGFGSHPLPDEVFNRRWYLKPGKMTPNPFGGMDQVKMNPGTNPDVLDRPAGPTDPEIAVLDVLDAKEGAPLSVLACYSLHYVGGIPREQASADYFGEFCRLLPERIAAGKDFVAMMANGTSGDINNIPFLVGRPKREPFEQVRVVAGTAADAVRRAREDIAVHHADATLGIAWREIVLRVRKPTEEQIAAAKAVLAVKDPKAIAALPRRATDYARRVLSLAKAEEILTAPLQVLRIGEFAVCAIPFETFAEIGLDIKRRSPFGRTMVIGVANGAHGYLPTPEQHALGGYETWMGTSRVQEDASVILTDALLEMLGQLHRASRPGDGDRGVAQ